MVCDEEADALGDVLRHTERGEQRACNGRPLLLLEFSGGGAVFALRLVDADIVQDGGCLQGVLGAGIQLLACTDGLRKAVDLDEMVYPARGCAVVVDCGAQNFGNRGEAQGVPPFVWDS